MEIEKLISALEQTISYLRNSESSDPSHISIEEMIRRLEAEVAKAKKTMPMDVIFLDRVFAPNGVIQQTALDNGWGTNFLRISEVIDRFTVGNN